MNDDCRLGSLNLFNSSCNRLISCLHLLILNLNLFICIIGVTLLRYSRLFCYWGNLSVVASARDFRNRQLVFLADLLNLEFRQTHLSCEKFDFGFKLLHSISCFFFLIDFHCKLNSSLFSAELGGVMLRQCFFHRCYVAGINLTAWFNDV